MRVFVYEFATAGGTGHERDHALAVELRGEGQAMLTAVVEDLTRGGADVQVLIDAELEPTLHSWDVPEIDAMLVRSVDDHQRAFARSVRQADYTLLIAPETGGALLRLAERAVALGGRLLGPGPEFIAIASDKQATAEALARRQVPTPRGAPWTGPKCLGGLRFPVVLKPRDGAGSHGVRLLRDADELESLALPASAPFRVEEFHAGLAASVALLLGPDGASSLVPCAQRLSGDGRFRYLGGAGPLSELVAARATALVEKAVAALPATTGYVGIDLVLGSEPTGQDDVVIEVNPRLTTSYVGLRRLYQSNLADAMLAAAGGQPPRLTRLFEHVEFDAHGQVAAGSATRTGH